MKRCTHSSGEIKGITEDVTYFSEFKSRDGVEAITSDKKGVVVLNKRSIVRNNEKDRTIVVLILVLSKVTW